MPIASFSWSQTLDAIVGLVAAYVFALPLAFERKLHGESAVGLRTVPLVSVGACGYLLVTRFLYDAGLYDHDGLARTLRAVMTGIGFIGGGAIVKQATDAHGLTTGAAVWSAGAIGAAIAHGHYEIGFVLGVTNVLVLEIQHFIEKRAAPKTPRGDPQAASRR